MLDWVCISHRNCSSPFFALFAASACPWASVYCWHGCGYSFGCHLNVNASTYSSTVCIDKNSRNGSHGHGIWLHRLLSISNWRRHNRNLHRLLLSIHNRSRHDGNLYRLLLSIPNQSGHRLLAPIHNWSRHRLLPSIHNWIQHDATETIQRKTIRAVLYVTRSWHYIYNHWERRLNMNMKKLHILSAYTVHSHQHRGQDSNREEKTQGMNLPSKTVWTYPLGTVHNEYTCNSRLRCVET